MGMYGVCAGVDRPFLQGTFFSSYFLLLQVNSATPPKYNLPTYLGTYLTYLDGYQFGCPPTSLDQDLICSGKTESEGQGYPKFYGGASQ